MDDIFHETKAKVFSITFHDINRNVIIQFKVAANINGIKKIGLSINGTPNINGSEIPKNAGITPIFATVFNCLDFDLSSIIPNAKVAPQPPIATKYIQNGVANIVGKTFTCDFCRCVY